MASLPGNALHVTLASCNVTTSFWLTRLEMPAAASVKPKTLFQTKLASCRCLQQLSAAELPQLCYPKTRHLL